VNNGAITFKGEHGVKVMGTGSANLDRVTITGGGSGQGKGVIKDGTGEMKMTGVNISGVKMGVEAIKGNLTINGHSTITFESGEKNYG
uniref:hypothetical protein n=1 Tax=Bartonella bovis TaxID=155194 RepID=UPI001304BAF3